MIEQFKDLEVRNSGIIYNSTFAQIKQMYEVDPERAGELAISAIELVLTGELSSDDMMISMLLEPMRKINENNQVKYETKVESARTKKMVDMKLDKIAEMVNRGKKQREIGEALGMSQQTVSYRVSLIKTSYPELLTGKPQTETENTNNFTKIQKNLQTNSDVYQNTKNTKTEDFVRVEEEEKPEVQPKGPYFDF
jgi:predicted transcriptional regulator